ncbi:ABC transporter substrate-binding protein [Xanthobacter versatilis]|uniref:Extracellular ligand-binding receptor n=1 Tax=Xanthobacter autotrophicus (strain ATCC BAA-1158 / Py2) TaxID=78245 RepID=A7IIV4_XANP2|nr:Extracellular ligand-binding receptor [Xanthobacter autotrophicus Py2]
MGDETSPRSGAFAINRRNLLLGATAGAIAMPWVSRAHAAEPIRIGMLYGKTGPIVGQSEHLAQGSFLALEQRGGTLLGRPTEIVWLDEPNPQGAQQNAERLVGEHKVAGLVGGALSSHAFAISAVAKKAKVPFIATNAAADALTGASCNRYTFRTQAPVEVQARVLAPQAAAIGKKWYLLTAAYAFGQDVKRFFGQYAKDNGGTIVGADDVPVGTQDFSSFILKIRAAKPDVVIGGIAGSDLMGFLKQWNELGMRGRIPFAEIAVGNTDLWGVGPEAADGLYTSTWYYKNPANPPDEQAMTAAYEKKYNRPPADKAWMGWFGTNILLDSIEAAGSTDPTAVVNAIERWQTKRGGTREISFRPFDHQLTSTVVVLGVKPKITDKWDFFDVKAEVPKTEAEANALYGPESASACKMESI